MASIDPEGAEERALDALVELAGKSVIEIGAGDGRLTWRLARRAANVLALEPQDHLVGLARAAMRRDRIGNVRFTRGDATTFRFPRNQFDAAVLSHSL